MLAGPRFEIIETREAEETHSLVITGKEEFELGRVWCCALEGDEGDQALAREMASSF